MSFIDALPAGDDRAQRRVLDRPAASVGTLRAEVVQSHEALDAMVAQWRELEEQASGAVLFQSCGWARAIFDFESARGNTAFEPVVVTLRDGGRLVAVLPLERISGFSRRVLVPLGHAFAQYSDLLVLPGYEPREVVGRMVQCAVTAAACDSLNFLKVRADSMLARGMPANRVEMGKAQGAPYVALDGFADFDAYFHTIKAKTRKNLRNARNRLEREGAVSHDIAATGDEALGVIARTLSGRAGRLREQGLSSRAFREEDFARFCATLPACDDIELLAMSLRCGDEPMAEQWGFVHGGRYYAYVASRDFSRSEESPGKLHLGEIIQACIARGLIGADLMVPAMPYKLTWATQVVPVADYALPVTPRGVLVIALWDMRLRPLLKSTALGMPTWLRSLLMRAIRIGR
jgi:CelD/BcsL family acetyltransferase involved in cellulose biosynthesis